jgi:hypothetical protein
MKIKTLLIVVLALCLTSSMALAATTVTGSGGWQDFVAANINQNGAPYWDQYSLDGPNHNQNVGYFLTGTGGVFGTNYLGTGAQFWGGAYTSGTDTGGAADTSSFALTPIFGPLDAVGDTKVVALTGNFGLYGISGDGNTYYSQSGLNAVDSTQQHFALFQDKNALGVFYAGFEDLSGSGGDEKLGDFNDLVIQFTPVPVPPSVLLMGSGLLGLVGLGWRRRKES